MPPCAASGSDEGTSSSAKVRHGPPVHGKCSGSSSPTCARSLTARGMAAARVLCRCLDLYRARSASSRSSHKLACMVASRVILWTKTLGAPLAPLLRPADTRVSPAVLVVSCKSVRRAAPSPVRVADPARGAPEDGAHGALGPPIRLSCCGRWRHDSARSRRCLGAPCVARVGHSVGYMWPCVILQQRQPHPRETTLLRLFYF